MGEINNNESDFLKVYLGNSNQRERERDVERKRYGNRKQRETGIDSKRKKGRLILQIERKRQE